MLARASGASAMRGSSVPRGSKNCSSLSASADADKGPTGRRRRCSASARGTKASEHTDVSSISEGVARTAQAPPSKCASESPRTPTQMARDHSKRKGMLSVNTRALTSTKRNSLSLSKRSRTCACCRCAIWTCGSKLWAHDPVMPKTLLCSHITSESNAWPSKMFCTASELFPRICKVFTSSRRRRSAMPASIAPLAFCSTCLWPNNKSSKPSTRFWSFDISASRRGSTRVSPGNFTSWPCVTPRNRPTTKAKAQAATTPTALPGIPHIAPRA
mmetsp:Transcript_70059/g.194704  ORF Transcript_70059/g.194704 Transcript_70059/m.194704 type:complete len:273 (+) Transcript_70059:929-1747(+)